jgi:hypothetical protein
MLGQCVRAIIDYQTRVINLSGLGGRITWDIGIAFLAHLIIQTFTVHIVNGH